MVKVVVVGMVLVTEVVAVKVGEVVGNTVLVTDVVVVKVVVGSTDLVKEVVGNGSTDAYLVPVVVVNGGRWSVVLVVVKCMSEKVKRGG